MKILKIIKISEYVTLRVIGNVLDFRTVLTDQTGGTLPVKQAKT